MRSIIAAGLLCFALSGCAAMSNLAVSLTNAGPTQATTIAEATQATTLAEQAVDLYVKNGNPSQAVLLELRGLVTGLHNTLQAAQAANSSGNSATAAAAIATFNEALAAFQAYATKQGVNS